MALQDYIITLEESEMTAELRALLESKGATVREAPIEKLHLPPDVEAQILADLEAADRGDFSSFKPWEQVREELHAYLKEKRENG